nr:hypothetical protein [uncultured Prevotella sp.]
MQTSKIRIRKDFAPLTVAVSIICKTPGSPMTQVYNAKANTYEPNRQLTPAVFMPLVHADASDGSLENPYDNTMLAQMKWLVNGLDITALPEWNGYYTIDTSNSNARGSIEITRNLTPNQRVELSFSGVIADNRLGVNIPITTDPVLLSTTDSSEDKYSISIAEDSIIQYDPFKDKLLLYDYKVGHNILEASDSARELAMNENSYKRTIPVTLHKGANECSEDYILKLFRVTGLTTTEEITADDNDNELDEITKTAISLDLRLVEKEDYVIIAYLGEKELARKQFGISRLYPVYQWRHTNSTSISPSDKERYDVAMVDCNGTVVECPADILKMVWMTDSATITGKEHNEGGTTLFMLKSTGIGNTYLDDWLDVYANVSQKPAYNIAVDESGNELVDESGNQLIFN